MFYAGLKGKLLPPRDVQLFLTDKRRKSVLYWRYHKKKTRGRGESVTLGAESVQVKLFAIL